MMTIEDIKAIKRATEEGRQGPIELIPEQRKAMIAATAFCDGEPASEFPDLLLDPDDVRHVVLIDNEDGTKVAYVYLYSEKQWEEDNNWPSFIVWDGQRLFMGLVAQAKGVDVLICPVTDKDED